MKVNPNIPINTEKTSLEKLPKQNVVSIIAITKNTPPIVGVPAFDKWL